VKRGKLRRNLGTDARSMGVARKPGREEWLAQLRAHRGRLPADLKFDRDEANARSFLGTNVLIYLASGGTAKADRVEALLGSGAKISVQVRNETATSSGARLAGCDRLWSEGRQDGVVTEGLLLIRNPFGSAGRGKSAERRPPLRFSGGAST
jgi:hypothetical protein